MAELPPKVEAGIEVLAKWAAKQPEGVKAGAEVAFMLYVTARVRKEASDEQIAVVRGYIEDFRILPDGLTTAAITELNQRICDLMGWPH